MSQIGEKRQWFLCCIFITLAAVFFAPAATFAAITAGSSAMAADDISASLTIDKPTGTVEGDVMIANFYQTNYVTNGPSLAGWTQLATVNFTDQVTVTLQRRSTVLYKVAGASEPASYIFSLGGTADVFIGSISTFSGVCNSAPIDVTGTFQASDDSTTTITAPGITTLTDNAAVVFLAQVDNNRSLSSWTTATAPGALTEIVDFSYNGSGSNDAAVGVAYAILATAGATGNGTAGITDPGDFNSGVLIALRPTPDTPEATSNSPVCAGSTLELYASPDVDGGIYSWTGPNSFTSSEREPTIENVSTFAFGTYYVTVNVNGCTSDAGTTDVVVNPAPLGCDITAPSSVVFGSTGNTASTVATPGATYDWIIAVDDVDMAGSLITAGAGTNSITWTAPDSFTLLEIGVTVTTDQGCQCVNDPPVGGQPGAGGGGVTITGQAAGSIPTLSEWGVIILSLLIALTAVLYLRKRNHMTV